MARTILVYAVACGLLVAALGAGRSARAEVVEEIVAWVEGSIITLSEFREEEQLLVQELYRTFAGSDLDRELDRARETLLMTMIDREILMNKAERMFDLDRAGDSYLKMVREQQGIKNDEELERLLARQGMTLAEFKKQMTERFAPQEVIRAEVGSRVSVSDAEVEAYYQDHPREFDRAGSVTFREVVLLSEKRPDVDLRAEAEQVRARLAEEGADFGEIAKEVSDAGTAAEGGLLGPLEQGELSEKLESVAFSLPIGQVSDVIEMPYGYHIIRVEERKEPGRVALDEVREELRQRIEDEKYSQSVEDYLQQAREEVDWSVNPKYITRIPADYRSHVRDQG